MNDGVAACSNQPTEKDTMRTPTDTRRTADWYTDGWFRDGDGLQVHLLTHEPPPEARAIKRDTKSYRRESGGLFHEWIVFCTDDNGTCVVCNRHTELYAIEESLRDGCGCYTTCGEICDACEGKVNQ